MHSIGGTKLFVVFFCFVVSFCFVLASEDPVIVTTKKDGQSLSVSNNPDKSSSTDNGEGEMKMSSKVFSDAKSFDKLYIEGQNAYHDQLWYSCASKLENAIKQYNIYKDIVTNCRLQCLKGQRLTQLSNFTITVEALGLAGFTYFFKTADCMRRCKEDQLGDQKHVTSDFDYLFEERRPYHYLQYCYYKLDKLKEAAAATYTFFLVNPKDEDAKSNMDYYKHTVRMPFQDFLDLEMTPYREHYIRATLAYVDKDWPSVVSNMEECLTEYFQEDERCRANCFDTGRIKGVELLTGVADLLIQVLMCQMSCEEKLSQLYTERDPHFMESIFHYLQFSNYQMENLDKSSEATASFLLLNPTHKVMRENREVIRDVLKVTDADFVPRKSMQDYMKRKTEMTNTMDFINKNYKWPDVSEDEGNIGEEALTEETIIPEDWMTRYEKLGMHLMAMSSDLHREERFVTDGLLQQEQCEELLNLMKNIPKQSNGAEVFDFKLAKQTMLEKLDEEYEASLRMLIRAGEVIRHYVQRFNNPDPSYFMKKTSIVCWGPGEDMSEKLDCYPQEDGKCLKYADMSEDYYKDLFTTVTYLTPVKKGGEFMFLGDKEAIDYSLSVKCGRTVGFNTGDTHSVEVPTDGSRRCAMIINHSTVKSDDERELKDTIALLHHLDELRLEREMKSSKDVMKSFQDKGVKVVKTGEELKGKERFVADGLTSEKECTALMDMVLKNGQFGDGYPDGKYPNMANELFTGISLDQAIESGAVYGEGYDHLFVKPSLISPHTPHEIFQGITIYRASKLDDILKFYMVLQTLNVFLARYSDNMEALMHEGKIPVFAMKAFLQRSEDSRLLIERYFNLTKPLFFDYTHLVCRTAVDDSNEDRSDLSHPVHADNCILQTNGSCTKGFPAFTQRDYSAILYLNEDFKGGDFFFAHSDTTEQVSLRPKCGRLVAFNSSEFHGVKAVRSGNRCAIALWFTLNPNFKELAHIQARKVLKEVESAKSHPAHLRSYPAMREDL